MNKLLIVLLGLVLVSTFDIKADDRVSIELWSESLCPYCRDFMATQVAPTLAIKDIYQISDFTIHAYGNARTTKNGSSYIFTCQHGASECDGNLIMTCVNRLYEKVQYANPFHLCFEKDSSNWNTTGAKCATQYGLDWSVISKCAYGVDGNNYLNDEGVLIGKLVPPHQYVPWITVNGAHDAAAENAIRTDMLKYICQNYKGTFKLDACKGK